MSYDIFAGKKNFNLTWNYNLKIIDPSLGEGGLKQFNEKPSIEAAEGIANIIHDLNAALRKAHSRSTLLKGFNGNGLPEFIETYGGGEYGHVLEGVLRLTEIMIACYQNPDEPFIIH
jgi:hypothetical protein